MREDEAILLGNAVLAEVINSLSIPQIRIAAGAAGIDASRIPARSEAQGGSGSRAQVAPALQRLYAELPHTSKERAIQIFAERVLGAGEQARDRLVRLLEQHGYQYIDGAFVPVGLLDEREAHHLPRNSASELAKAASRLWDGEESAAITSACGAVDLATSAAYEKYGLGKLPNSFQTRVNVVMEALKIYEEIEQELTGIAIKPEDAKKIAEEMHATVKHAANTLEIIRRTQADAHGTKPAYRRIAYDAVKWASAICGLLEGKI
jgi:hypothetical protein